MQNAPGNAIMPASHDAPRPEDAVGVWKRISGALLTFMRTMRLHPLDIYLVGSTVRCAHRTTSDIDSVIIIQDDLTKFQLRDVREQMLAYLHAGTWVEKYHFKLFGMKNWQRLGEYDGFRLLEFKTQNVSLLGTHAMWAAHPVLSTITFESSVIIQAVYEYLSNPLSEKPLDDLASEQVFARAKRNAWLWKRHGVWTPGMSISPVECLQRNKLFQAFEHARNSGSRSNVLAALTQYLDAYEHEYVNKYREYCQAIKRRFQND
jgi:hypothetical protein